MEGEWLAYLEQLAQQERRQGQASPADAGAAPKPDAKAAPTFVCEEPPSE
jgi:hypothetical protein